MRNIIEQAILKRKILLDEDTNCCRLINGLGDDLDGLTLDQYGQHFQIQLFKTSARKYLDTLYSVLKKRFAIEYLTLKWRVSPDGKDLQNPDMEAIMGNNPICTIKEHGVKYQVDLSDTINAGLFLDMRAGRKQVMEQAQGKNVLNLFSYTCSYGLAAAKGGANQSINVDVSGKILDKGRLNYSINEISTAHQSQFLRRDCRKYLKTCIKKEQFFDIIILDPPSFSRTKEGVFSVKNDMETMISDSMSILNPKGYLYLSSNYSRFVSNDLMNMVKQQSNCSIKIHNQSAGIDFPRKGNMPESAMSQIVVYKK